MNSVLKFLLLMVCAAAAQERTGGLHGVVRDPSGGVVRGAHIEAQNAETGLARATQTDSRGTYLLVHLPVGIYRVTAAKPGFQNLRRAGVRVLVDGRARVDFDLALASERQSVTVVEDAPQVNADNASTGLVVGTQMADLPLNGRNFTQLGTLLPGAAPPPQRLITSLSANHAFAVNGQRTQSNNFLLDGMSNNDTLNSGYVLTPPPDALDQFRILTHNYSAEYGSHSGSIVHAVTRSGTNDWHGGLWEFLRNDALDARGFFAVGKPPLRQNQFGASTGGPVLRSRMFLFGYYEGLRTREGMVQDVFVLSDFERQGDFSRSTPAPRDPLSGGPFPGGLIPASRASGVSRRLVDELVPRANLAGNRFNRAPARRTAGDQYGARLDHRPSERNSLFFRYAGASSGTANPLGAGTFSPAGSGSDERHDSLTLSDTHAFTPTLLTEAGASFLRQFARPATWSGLDLARFGFDYPATEPSARGLPFSNLSGLFSIGDVQQAFTQVARNTYQFSDRTTCVRGRHTVKFGGEARRSQIFLVFPNRPNGDFTFTGAATGNTAADFLAGLPAQFRQGGGDPSKHFLGADLGFFAQDDFKLTPRLTVNLGLRYDLGFPYYDKYDRMASFQPGRQSRVRPDAPVSLLYPGDPGVPRATIPTDANNFAPRFGFAWDMFGDGRTSLRGGYGIYFDTVPGIAVFQNINVPPFNRFVQLDPPSGFANPYAGLPVNPQTDPARAFPCPCLVIGFSPDFVSPYAQHFNLGLERQISRNLMAAVGYVGTAGVKFPGYLEVNPAVPGPGATRANTQARRLYRDYNLVRPTFSEFNSNYHSLQARLDKRLSGGLAFLASYTWSKAIDYQSSVNLGDPRPQDAFSLRDVRGLAIFDTRHRLVLSYIWQLPRLANAHPGVRQVFGGWRLAGILAAQSGNPLTATEPVDRSLRGLNADRPDQVADPNDGPKTVAEWFRTAAFVRLPDTPGGQRSGTAGRNTIIGPGLFQNDLAAVKTFPVRDRSRLEVRAEWFNALNRANFLNPSTNLGAPQTFGVIQSARPARVIQLAVKFSF